MEISFDPGQLLRLQAAFPVAHADEPGSQGQLLKIGDMLLQKALSLLQSLPGTAVFPVADPRVHQEDVAVVDSLGGGPGIGDYPSGGGFPVLHAGAAQEQDGFHLVAAEKLPVRLRKAEQLAPGHADRLHAGIIAVGQVAGEPPGTGILPNALQLPDAVGADQVLEGEDRSLHDPGNIGRRHDS